MSTAGEARPPGNDLAVGLSLPLDRHQTASGAVRLAAEAERAGLDRICSGELASFDSLALLAAVAMGTQRVRLMSTVVSILARSTSLLAMGAATLADLSGGRYSLGVGAGSPAIGAWHGRSLDRPVETMDRALTEVRTALSGEPVPETGFRIITGAVPYIPIYLAALNPRMLDLAGRRADGVVVTFAGPEQLAPMVDTVRRAAEKAGRPCPDVVANCWVSAGEDQGVSERRLRETVVSYFAVPTYRRLAYQMAGDRTSDHLAHVYEHHGRAKAAAAVPDRVMELVTAPVTVTGLQDKATAYAAAGATSLHVIPIRSDSSDASVLDVIRTLGELRRSTLPA